MMTRIVSLIVLITLGLLLSACGGSSTRNGDGLAQNDERAPHGDSKAKTYPGMDPWRSHY